MLFKIIYVYIVLLKVWFRTNLDGLNYRHLKHVNLDFIEDPPHHTVGRTRHNMTQNIGIRAHGVHTCSLYGRYRITNKHQIESCKLNLAHHIWHGEYSIGKLPYICSHHNTALWRPELPRITFKLHWYRGVKELYWNPHEKERKYSTIFWK
jgi:hypothetical protein